MLNIKILQMFVLPLTKGTSMLMEGIEIYSNWSLKQIMMSFNITMVLLNFKDENLQYIKVSKKILKVK